MKKQKPYWFQFQQYKRNRERLKDRTVQKHVLFITAIGCTAPPLSGRSCTASSLTRSERLR